MKQNSNIVTRNYMISIS